MRRYLLGTLLLAGACASPTPHLSPRTLPAGGVQHVLGLEAAVVQSCESDSCMMAAILAPSYGLRIGVLDRLELGGRLSLLEGRLDAKAQLLRTDLLDVAVAPQVAVARIGLSDSVARQVVSLIGSAPLLVGVNATDDVSIVAFGGPSSGTDFRSYSWPIWADAGLGVDVRVSPSVRLQPTVAMSYVGGDTLRNALHGPFVGLALGLGDGPRREGDPELRPPDGAKQGWD